MMKLIKYLLMVLCLTAMTQQAEAQNRQVDKVYLYGFAASFNDSTVYFTDIQEVRGAYMHTKSKFLVNRDEYSHQLRNYLKEKGYYQPTCITCYAYDRKKAQKGYDKLRRKYTVKAKNRFVVIDIKEQDFKYQPVTPDEN